MVPNRRRARYDLCVASLLSLVLALPRSAAGEEPPPKLIQDFEFAFDFGNRTTPVMNQFVGVFDSTLYTPELGHGMAGGRPSSIPEPLPFPTRMLGDGLSLPAGGFRVDLAGGEYLGWISFERGGFWENQAAAYSHAALKVNGVTVHEHEYTSPGMGRPDLWDRLVEATFAPCVSKHDEGVIQKLAGAGKHPWVYNNGMDRYALGLHLWRNMRIGVEGRLEWIGVFTQGFAFHNLDGREPSRCCFLIHRDLGALKTPMWFSAREGLLDARIRLSLEQAAPASDPALRLWTIDGYNKDRWKWNDAAMEKARLTMLMRLEELTER